MNLNLPQNSFGKFNNFLLSLSGWKLAFATVICMLIVIIPIFIGLLEGNFSNNKLDLDIKRDWANILFYAIGFPSMFLTTVFYSSRFPRLLNQLKENGVVEIDKERWSKFIQKSQTLYSKWYYTFGPHVISFLVTLMLIFIFRNPKNAIWYSLETNNTIYIAGWTLIFIYYLTFYTFSLGLLNIFASYKILNILFTENKIVVQPLHPDKCGGLSKLGDLSKTLIYWILAMGIIVAVNLFNNKYNLGRGYSDPLQITIILGYLLMAYIVFFLPLHAAHKPMKKAKEEELNIINDYLLKFNTQVRDDLQNNRDIDDKALANFNNARQLYQFSTQMPVYPYNFKTILYFSSSVIIPIVIIVFEKLLFKFIGLE